jgi:uncharacterized protein YndB with AHSA1/START domain
MLKIFARILAVIVVLIAGVLVYAATTPDSFKVQRSATIKAPPEKVFALIDNMQGFNRWNPYERMDPGKGTYRGPAAGKGSAYAWDSTKLGAGSMEIAETKAPLLVTMKLDFVKPFEAHNMAEFTLVPHGDSTEVTWAMHGPMPFISKVMCVFISMDKMVGKDFTDGLANLKALAEG